MPTDTSERDLERLICTALTGHACDPPRAGEVAEPQPGYGGVGWTCGNPNDYDKALQRVMTAVLKDDTELFKQFMDNESFRRWMTDTVFGLTYESLSR